MRFQSELQKQHSRTSRPEIQAPPASFEGSSSGISEFGKAPGAPEPESFLDPGMKNLAHPTRNRPDPTSTPHVNSQVGEGMSDASPRHQEYLFAGGYALVAAGACVV